MVVLDLSLLHLCLLNTCILKNNSEFPRDIEIKNIVTIATGEWGGNSGERVYRSYYKGHKDKIKGEGRGGGGRWDWLGCGRGKGRKCLQL